MKRETIGKISSDLLLKQPESRDPIELQREMTSEYLKYLIDCANQHKNIYPGDFYLIVITKNERLMPNVFRNYFTARMSCPTPDYDQAVYKYNRKKEEIEFVWVIPCKDACIHLLKNKEHVTESERPLLNFIVDFWTGNLFEKSKKLNGEEKISPVLEK